MKHKGFSIAEAMITLLIVSVGLAAMAPMMSKKNKPVADVAENGGIPSGAIMFFDLNNCPNGWEKINQDGHYLRITTDSTKNGELLEDMVHKHKHVSPVMQSLRSDRAVNTARYGPFASFDSDYTKVIGDASYPQMSYTSQFNDFNNAFLRAGQYGSDDNNNWYLYTSDGTNGWESVVSRRMHQTEVLVCPNRDEGDVICKKDQPNSFTFSGAASGSAIKSTTVKNLPYLADMSLVGNETRPKSISYIACKKK